MHSGLIQDFEHVRDLAGALELFLREVEARAMAQNIYAAPPASAMAMMAWQIRAMAEAVSLDVLPYPLVHGREG